MYPYYPETGPGPSVTAPLSTKQGIHGPQEDMLPKVCVPHYLCPDAQTLECLLCMDLSLCQRLWGPRPQAYPRTVPVRTKSFVDLVSPEIHLLSIIVLNSFTNWSPELLYLCSAGCRTKLLSTRDLESVLIWILALLLISLKTLSRLNVYK